jgi:hypothetical protein
MALPAPWTIARTGLFTIPSAKATPTPSTAPDAPTMGAVGMMPDRTRLSTAAPMPQ